MRRRLSHHDSASVENLLREHAQGSMFLRSNLAKAGYAYEGKRLQGEYFGSFLGDAVTDVVGHAWNGVLLLQTPKLDRQLITHAVAETSRPVTGLIGPWPQVVAARSALQLGQRPTTLESCEDFFTLELSELRLATPEGCHCRPARRDDIEELIAWRGAYERQLLGRNLGNDELDAIVRRSVEEQNLFVLDQAGRRLSQSSFNAELPDCVQIGGVFTPPHLRGRGYGGAVVAGSLELARSKGVRSAVLFTQKDNIAARRAYERVGFRRVGDFGLILFS